MDSYELASSWIELVKSKFSRASRSEAYCVVGLNSIWRFLRERFEISDITLAPRHPCACYKLLYSSLILEDRRSSLIQN